MMKETRKTVCKRHMKGCFYVLSDRAGTGKI